MSISISLANDFNPVPIGREKGKKFREEILLPKIQEAERNREVVVVSLDGAEGVGSSFADEAFAGLVADGRYTAKRLRELLRVEAKDAGHKPYIELLWEFVDEAQNNRDREHA